MVGRGGGPIATVARNGSFAYAQWHSEFKGLGLRA